VVDLDLEVEVASDTIEATADYRGITETVRAVIQEGSFDLIESMAQAIADRILAMPHVTRVTALVHKPNAAVRLGIDGVTAAATAPPMSVD
jgi:dihydroneopterin aldolase